MVINQVIALSVVYSMIVWASLQLTTCFCSSNWL